MKTVVRSDKKVVTIDTEGALVIAAARAIGESGIGIVDSVPRMDAIQYA